MKKLIILVVILISINPIIAQTYISPIIGYDFTDMKTNDDELGYVHISEKKYGVSNLIFGLEVKQKLKNRYEFVAYSTFSKRFANGWLFNILPFDGLRFNYFQNGILLNYKFQNFFFGLGANYNILTNLTLTLDEKKVNNPFINQLNEKGFRVVLGKSYKNFNLEAYFYKGLTSNLDNNKIQLFPVNSLGLSLSYDIKVFDGFKKKTKADCPKF